MDAKRLERLQKQLYSQTSLIGEWQQRQAVAALVRDGSPEAQDALCCAVIEQDHPLAREAALSNGLAPREAGTRALFFFLTEQWEKYERLDFDQSLLRVAYAAADETLRRRIAEQARRAGRVEWVGVVTGGATITTDGGRPSHRLGEMTDAEWETTLAVLGRGQRGEEMWRLAQVAPPLWSARLLRQVRQAQWSADEAERDGFEELVRLAEICGSEAPDIGGQVRYGGTLQGHTDAVWCLVLSADGRLLASGSSDHTVRLWRLPEGTPIKTLKGHSRHLNYLALSADGRLLVSGSDDPISNRTVRLWRLPEGTPIKTLKGNTRHLNCLVLSADGRLLASGSRAEPVGVQLWRLPEGTPIKMLKGHKYPVTRLALSADGRLLASGSSDYTVRLWRLPEGTPLKTLKGHSDTVTCLALSADGRLLASGSHAKVLRVSYYGSRDKAVRLWESEIAARARQPIVQATLSDLAAAQKALRSEKTTKAERAWLEFMEALMLWRRRFDIHIEDVPSRIDVGEFDIEIEG